MPTRRGFTTHLLAATVLVLGARPIDGAGLSIAGNRRRRWPAGHKGAVSLTYDDGLDSQLDVAVPQLDARGLRATFFVTQSNIRRRLNDWIAVGREGHEIANHTLTHPCDLRGIEPATFVEREIVAMERWLDAGFGRDRPHSFAYPCDVTDLGPGSANDQAQRYAELLRRGGLTAARISEGPPNSVHFVRQHPYRLQAFALGYDSQDPAALWGYLQYAARKGRWAILVIHDVVRHSHGQDEVSARLHAQLLDNIIASPLWCAPMGEVFAHLTSRRD